jgi:hypothetical protein
MSETSRTAPLFKAGSVMLGLYAQKSEDSPTEPDRIRVTYAGWDPPRLARMATMRLGTPQRILPTEGHPRRPGEAALGCCAIRPRRWARLRG